MNEEGPILWTDNGGTGSYGHGLCADEACTNQAIFKCVRCDSWFCNECIHFKVTNKDWEFHSDLCVGCNESMFAYITDAMEMKRRK